MRAPAAASQIETRDARVVQSEQQQRAVVGGVERFPAQSAALARHEVDAVEYQAARARVRRRSGKPRRIAA